VIAASVAFGLFWAPATAFLTDGVESVGLELALGFALMNFAWAPGHIAGSAIGGGIAELGGDVAAYAFAAGLCAVTLAVIRRAHQAWPVGTVTEAATSG
jgi:hypothetical protein